MRLPVGKLALWRKEAFEEDVRASFVAEPLRLSVLNYEEERDTRGIPVLNFVIETIPVEGGSPVMVRRTFAELQDLHRVLKDTIKIDVKLPPKRFFAQLSVEDKTARAVQIETYLHGVLRAAHVKDTMATRFSVAEAPRHSPSIRPHHLPRPLKALVHDGSQGCWSQGSGRPTAIADVQHTRWRGNTRGTRNTGARQ